MNKKYQYFEENLYFYKVIKQLIKCKLTSNNRNVLRSIILNNLNVNTGVLYKTLLISDDICKKTNKNYAQFQELAEILNEIGAKRFIDFTTVALDLISLKELIIMQSKYYSEEFISIKLSEVKDRLSIKYDCLSIDLPYAERVISALLTDVFINAENSSQINGQIIKESNNTQIITEIKQKLRQLEVKYNLNSGYVFLLIVNESINQSIISSAGISYEDRVQASVISYVDDIEFHKHDSKHNEIEYDFILHKNGKKIGVSAKRTLRERYKQNIADCDDLDVDYLCIITLGIDLSNTKVKNILAKNNLFLIVAEEVYNSSTDFSQNPKIISSNKIQEFLESF
ncbi:hypothetical protein ACNQ1M_02190 [Mycoplasma sp. VS424B]|uniref:hypothetical protein n=1 Tax=Mycoplasma sp. VS424B TaxID=3401660 RepID=UPI003AB0A979